MKMPAINVFTKPDASELRLERISRQSSDVAESCARFIRLATRLRTAAAASTAAELQLAALNDEMYTLLSEHLAEEGQGEK